MTIDNKNENWTKENIFEFVKNHPEIKKRSDLKQYFNERIYRHALKLNILDQLFGERISWTPETIRQFIKEHPEIKTRTQLKKFDTNVYYAAKRNNILDELFGILKHKIHLGPDDVLLYLNEHPEIQARTHLRNQNHQLFLIASRNNMLDDLFPKHYHPNKYTKENIYKIVESHPEIKTRHELEKFSPRAYEVAKKMGILQDLFGDPCCKTWTPDDIRNFVKEHPEFKSRHEMQSSKEGCYAYNKARELNMLDELFGKPMKVISYSSDEIRQYIAEHTEIKTRKDLEKNNPSIYNRAKQLKLLDELFGSPQRKRRWTGDMVKELVAEHPEIKNRGELWKFNHRAYDCAKRLGMLEELFGPTIYKYWTKEDCAQVAQMCFSRGQFSEEYQSAYNCAKRNGWLDEICAHMNNSIYDFTRPGKYAIYVYEDVEHNYAYVGLSNNPHRRDYEHLMRDDDPIYKHCKKYNIPVPEMKILKTDLSASQAILSEKEEYLNYKNAGWNMLNAENCLGFLGGNVRYRSNAKKEIKKILKEHPEITTTAQLKAFSSEAYNAAKFLNILDEFGFEDTNNR